MSRRSQVLLSERGKARSCSGSRGAGYHLSRRAWMKSRLEDLGVDRDKYAWGAGEGRWGRRENGQNGHSIWMTSHPLPVETAFVVLYSMGCHFQQHSLRFIVSWLCRGNVLRQIFGMGRLKPRRSFPFSFPPFRQILHHSHLGNLPQESNLKVEPYPLTPNLSCAKNSFSKKSSTFPSGIEP